MKPRIVGASLAGLALVVGSYWASDNGSAARLPQDAALAVVAGEAPPRTYIETKDTNADGVPDWQEALRVTQPLELTEMASSTYEVPDTITDQFAVDFFQSFMHAKTIGPYGNGNAQIIDQALDDLQAKTRDELFGPESVASVVTQTPAGLQAYGNAVLRIAASGAVTNQSNEAEITLTAVKSNQPELLAPLDEKIRAYDGYVEQMLLLPVPQGLVQPHLNLVNSYNAVRNDIKAMRGAFDDPLYALVRLQRYQEDAAGLGAAFDQLFAALEAAGVTSYTVE